MTLKNSSLNSGSLIEAGPQEKYFITIWIFSTLSVPLMCQVSNGTTHCIAREHPRDLARQTQYVGELELPVILVS